MTDKPRSPFDLTPRASSIAASLQTDAKKGKAAKGRRDVAQLFPKRFHVYSLASKGEKK